MSESSAATLTPGIKTVDSSAEAGVVGRYVLIFGFWLVTDDCLRQVRDEHRQDYDAGRGGWGAQAQYQMKAQREREAVYADAKDGPGAVAVGGGDWKEGSRSLLPSTPATC
jgi:hypothetical protein